MSLHVRQVQHVVLAQHLLERKLERGKKEWDTYKGDMVDETCERLLDLESLMRRSPAIILLD